MTANFYTHARLIAWGFVAVVLCAFLVFALVAGASAQEQTPTGNETVPEEEIAEQLGDLVIHSYNFQRGDGEEPGEWTFEVSWTGRAPEQVTFTEMIELDEAGSTQISFQRQRLRPDERTEITVPAEIRSGGTAAMMITTPESVDAGNALVVQDGDPESRPAIRFQNVVLAMGLSSGLTAAGAFMFVLRRKHSEEYGKERIA
jgi:hypothetical protein